ncbi:MAG: tRNA pseudouridine(55) synthase TruB [bacterium]|nr:tRNA pseudouridine(55) synthase TruB [bacterium]
MNGIINVIKPPLITSYKVVELIKRKFKVRHIGHLGVLDPIATGLLQIAVGSATKLFDYFISLKRAYRVELLLGISTDTQDSAGTPTKILDNVSITGIEEVINSFKGEILQTPPMYSTLHYKGKRLYELAREGIEVPREPRRVIVESIDILEIKEGKYPRVILDVVCQKGTYIRSLCNDIGEKLGVGGHMASLIRTKIGSIDLTKAYPLTEILERGSSILDYFMPWTLLEEMKRIDLTVKKQRDDFIKGKSVPLFKAPYSRKEFVSVWYNGICIGVGKVSQDTLFPIAIERLDVS